MEIRPAFVTAVELAADLIHRPEVAEGWERPSVLPGFPLGGVVAHLARNVLRVREAVGRTATEAPRPLLDHFTGDLWPFADRDHEVHVAIRERALEFADAGPSEVLARLDEVLAWLRTALPGEPADRVVPVPNRPWCLTLDDYLVTRLVEVVVHTDDVAVSVGLPTPDLPETVTEPVITVLARLAAWRHGAVPVLRALTRVERAPASIAAF